MSKRRVNKIRKQIRSFQCFLDRSKM